MVFSVIMEIDLGTCQCARVGRSPFWRNMARPRKVKEEPVTVPQEAPAKLGYTDLFHKIDHLSGKDRQRFTKTLTTEEKKAYIAYCKERDCEKVTGIFRCFEPVGGTVEMNAMAYPGEDPVKYAFFDGMEYTVPRYVARRFENEFQGVGTWYPTHSHIMDINGQPIINVAKKNRRFGFSSMDFQ